VNFSSENIQGQVLRILGEEYVIDSKSDNSKIILVSDNNKKIRLEDGEKAKIKKGLFFNDLEGNFVKITKGEGEKVIMFEIGFNLENKNEKKLKIKESYNEGVFEDIELSFEGVNDEFADVKVGGKC